MIIFVRTASVASGKAAEAMAFARDVSIYFSKHFGVKLTVMVPLGGNPNRIGWRAEYDSLAQLEETISKVSADADYQGMIANNAHFFSADTVADQIWRVL